MPTKSEEVLKSEDAKYIKKTQYMGSWQLLLKRQMVQILTNYSLSLRVII